jgi:deoxycytidylate deaminase
MNKRLAKCVEISLGLKPSKQTGQSFHATFVFNKNKIISIGVNNYHKMHPYHRMGKYLGYKKNPREYKPCIHSEISALLKLGEEDCSRYSFVNVRIDNNGELSMAKPCPNCQRVLEGVGYKRIFYSTSEKGFLEIRS